VVTSSSNAFDSKPTAWESDKNMKEALLGFCFESCKSICMVQIKWHNESLSKSVDFEVSDDNGYSYRTVMTVTHKLKEARTDILFSAVSGTHFQIRLKGIMGKILDN
jgi:hypothetical protein